MGYYIGTYDECNNYLQEVNNIENYQGTTTTWSTIKSHPTDENLFAILKNNKLENEELTYVEELSEDWFPSESEI